MVDIRLNSADEEIIKELRNGRATPQYLSEQTELSREYISQRLTRLLEHGVVERLAPGLYELVPEEVPNADTRDKNRE